MKCVGGPMDGKEVRATARYLEAMTEDFCRIAQYEQRGGEYRLIGYFAPTHDGERLFEPVTA